MGATIDQLQNMDMAYAPPFSTAIHPFVTAVNLLENKLAGKLDSITPLEFLQGKAEDYRIIDAAIQPKIAGAPYVNLTEVNGEVKGLGKEEKLLLVCDKGKRAYLLQNRLRHFGYQGAGGRFDRQPDAKAERSGDHQRRGHQAGQGMGIFA